MWNVECLHGYKLSKPITSVPSSTHSSQLSLRSVACKQVSNTKYHVSAKYQFTLHGSTEVRLLPDKPRQSGDRVESLSQIINIKAYKTTPISMKLKLCQLSKT